MNHGFIGGAFFFLGGGRGGCVEFYIVVFRYIASFFFYKFYIYIFWVGLFRVIHTLILLKIFMEPLHIDIIDKWLP